MKDKEGRKIDYMRISLTDRCNLRCQYCMPAEGVPLIGHKEVLRLEEVLRIVKGAATIGVTKIRLTGGEPLLRKGIIHLIREIKRIEGIEEVAITTNGLLLDNMLDDLIQAGLDRVNLSLDTLDEETFSKISRFSGLENIQRALIRCIAIGIPVKINTVAIKGMNDEDILKLAKLTYKWPVDIRFIELMPIGCGKSFTGFSTETLLQLFKEAGLSFESDHISRGNGPAEYIRLKGAKGRVGFISPLSHQFCDACNRIRITPEGFLKPCLHSKEGINIKRELQNDISQEELISIIEQGILMKPVSHRFLEETEIQDSRNMNQIGG